jgi:hypothetical protein
LGRPENAKAETLAYLDAKARGDERTTVKAKCGVLKMRVSGLKIVAALLCCASLALAQQSSQTARVVGVVGVVGTWHLVRIDAPGPDGKPMDAPQPIGMLIYTPEGHAAVQLMYAQTDLSNEFVHDGYEATFGSYEVDETKHQLTYHIQGSATRDKLVGKNETLIYELPDNRHMIIRPAQADQHWSVTWERY